MQQVWVIKDRLEMSLVIKKQNMVTRLNLSVFVLVN